jgi:hypothetical protein
MTKKMFLRRQRTIPETEHPSVSSESGTVLLFINNTVLDETVQLPFDILDESSKTFWKFNKTGRSLLIKFKSPTTDKKSVTYPKECIIALTNYLVDEAPGRDLVGLRIRNTENMEDRVMGISLRRRDQLKPNAVWSVLGKVIQSNARFELTDQPEVHLDHVRMPAGKGNRAEERTGRSLDVLSAVERVSWLLRQPS